MIVTDEQGRILLANPAFETVTGYTQEEVLGKNRTFFVPVYTIGSFMKTCGKRYGIMVFGKGKFGINEKRRIVCRMAND